MTTEITVPDIGDFESVEIIEILVTTRRYNQQKRSRCYPRK